MAHCRSLQGPTLDLSAEPLVTPAETGLLVFEKGQIEGCKISHVNSFGRVALESRPRKLLATWQARLRTTAG